MNEHIKMLGHIKSRDDFLRFTALFRETVSDSAVRNYLESLSAWAADMDGYYQNSGREIPQNIDWDFIAALLYAGSIYE